ncbi:sulfur carrier protein ThiS [Leptothrix discophora]|uniref:Sulfur carrier protein ThiS n=1 Tax=Leptothrix discophora TaxID=89 RepID=A0ABT9FY94_LEPDI|nr:sulfur carrier protein ThiS [Leptothrix discophora]MDP4299199.1 sulfur carrier protein ThiS [Leptothrix discophora]
MNTHESATLLNLTLDGQPVTARAGSTLAELLAQHPSMAELAPERYATAVDGVFVARAHRVSHILQDGQAISVFQAIVGG